ncbi:hypothetical protein AAHH67_27645 [Niallia circulans]
MDEPTAALTESDVEILIHLLQDLRSQGVTCIYISHKLGEVMSLADSVTILRDGQTISTNSIEELSEDKIVTKMVGRELTELFPYEEHAISKENILEVKDYTVYDEQGNKIINQVSFLLKREKS